MCGGLACDVVRCGRIGGAMGSMKGLTATKSERNQEQATATCHDCAATSSVLAAHTHSGGFARGGSPILRLNNEGQAMRKLEKLGWAYVGATLRCPECEAKRKAEKGTGMAATEAKAADPKTTDAREPDGRQKRLIILALEDAYDDVAKRYRGKSTDRTVADEIGGIMPGWVTAIREEMFGPAGNEEIDALRADIAKLRASTEDALAKMEKRLADIIASHDRRVKA